MTTAEYNYPPKECKRMSKRQQEKIQEKFQRQEKIQAALHLKPLGKTSGKDMNIKSHFKSERPRPPAIKLTGTGSKIELRALLFVLQEQSNITERKKPTTTQEYQNPPDNLSLDPSQSLGNIVFETDNSRNSKCKVGTAYKLPNKNTLSPQYLYPPNESPLQKFSNPPPPENLSPQYLYAPNWLLAIKLNYTELIFSTKTLSPQYLHPPNETTGKLGEIPAETQESPSDKKLYIPFHQKTSNQKLSPQYLFPPNEPGPTQYQYQRLMFRPRNEETPENHKNFHLSIYSPQT